MPPSSITSIITFSSKTCWSLLFDYLSPTGEYSGEAPDVEHLGRFNPNVNDYAHVKKGIKKHTSMTMDISMMPKENKWSAVVEQGGHAEPPDDMSTWDLITYKTMLYATMGSLRGSIMYNEYVVKQKKREFGEAVYDVLEIDGKVGPSTLKTFDEFKAEIDSLEDQVSFKQNELVKLRLVGESDTLKKPRSPRAAKPGTPISARS